MIFTSFTFILLFMPAVLLMNRCLHEKARLPFLLCASLFFYGWGNPVWLPLLLYSILLNFAGGFCIEKAKKGKKAVLWALIIANLLPLLYFKYSGMLVSAFETWTGRQVLFDSPLLPAGISFFTFQGMSYILDVYRKKAAVQPSFVKFGVYLTLFPQLVAGPIVRYTDMEEQLKSCRAANGEEEKEGMKRFLLGFSKKLLIADSMGRFWGAVSQRPSQAGLLGSWLGLIAFSFQIYFDFSAYSDMAIGLGKMMGFTWPENFDRPYQAKSLTDFWRRWHMTLTAWFKEYVYIPLGGSRRGTVRRDVNLLIVWALTGLWHGAAWHFMLWGLYFAVLLIFEKRCCIGKKWTEKLPDPIKNLWTYGMVLIGWGIFTGCDLSFFQSLAGMNGLYAKDQLLLILSFLPLLLFTGVLVFSTRIRQPKNLLILLLLFLLSLAALAAHSFTPFVYFQF